MSQVLHFRSRSLRPTPSGKKGSCPGKSARIQSESSSETYIENRRERFRFEILLCIVVRMFVEGKEGLQKVLDYVNKVEQS